MTRNDGSKPVYSATYSNVPVYEYNIEGNHVMRRRSDDWINATHILKVAEYDKPTRTRILEREVQKGVHEKVQGGYGKYQGTWIPLVDGRELAAKNRVLDKLRPIFDFVPGDRSPPPAPKHSTAASTRPRASRAPAQPRRQPAQTYTQPDYDAMDVNMRDEATPDNVTTISESAYDEYDMSHYTHPRKRARVEDVLSHADTQHRMWAEELLDYFTLQDSELDSLPHAPLPPDSIDLNRPIDEKGHTALHWAAAMGDLEIVKDLIRRGAATDIPSKNGETALMRAVMFTNSWDRQNMDKIAGLLLKTITATEWFGSTVFHHIANTTQRKSKYPCARYYMDTLLNKMSELYSPGQIEGIVNLRDNNGDTAGTIAARYGARKCVRSLLGRNADMSIVNNVGQTAEQFIVQLNSRRQERAVAMRQLSSSPFQGDHHPAMGGAVQRCTSNAASFDPTSSMNGGADVYRSEAAIGITSQIVPVVFTKAKALASGLEEEMAECDAGVAEAERVLATRRAEAEAVRRQQEELLQREQEQMREGLVNDEQLQQELQQLEEECGGLTTEEADVALQELIEAEKRDPATNGNGGPATSEAEETKQQLRLARQLLSLSQTRRELIDSVVQSIASASSAGLDPNAPDHQEQYKRLITGALGVREEDVEGMLPEILTELEESRAVDGVGA